MPWRSPAGRTPKDACLCLPVEPIAKNSELSIQFCALEPHVLIARGHIFEQTIDGAAVVAERAAPEFDVLDLYRL